MIIQKFIHEIVNNISKSQPIKIVYQDVNLYFGSLDYFRSYRIEEGIMIFWEGHKLFVSPLFNKKYKLCSHCFLEHRNQFKLNDFFGQGSKVVEIDGNNLYSEKLLYAISQLVQLKSESPLFDYFIIDDYRISRHQFFRIANCDTCISNDKKCDNTVFNSIYECQASSLREKLGDYSRYIQLDNKDTGFFRRELTTLLNNAVTVELQYPLSQSEMISGIGIDTSYKKARSKAFLEAMERYSGIISKGQKRLFFSLNDLSREIIDYLNPNEYLSLLGKTKINQDTKIHWLSAHNYQTQKTTLIPEDFIIYKTERKPISQKLINMSSNGHALGNTYKEAVIFSLFEMYERDYFLFHWYERKSPKEVNLSSIFDLEINHYLKLIKNLGYEVLIYQLLSSRVMSIYWAFARGKNSNKFATYSTAGAHLFGKTAIISALKELYFALYAYDQDVVLIQENGHRMRPQDITTVADHAIYYSIEERSQNFDFLKDAEIIDFVVESDYSIDVDTYYSVLLEFTNKKFGNFYIVENTPIGLKEIGLCEVKVFVPGMQDMNFGYENQYINHRRVRVSNHREIPIHPFP